MDLRNDFSNKLNNVVDWRIKELASIDIELDSILSIRDIPKKSFIIRSAIALIYAHFEGAIKDIFLEYVKLLNNLLKNNLLAFNKNTAFVLDLTLYRQRETNNFQKIICDISTLNKLLKREDIQLESYKEIVIKNIEELKDNCKDINYLNQIEKFLLNENIGNLKIVNNVVNTESNLGFEVLINLLNKFDIEVTNDILIQKIHINQLLKNRNDIAHGESKFIYENSYSRIDRDINDVRKQLEIIIILIENIKILVEDRKEEF